MSSGVYAKKLFEEGLKTFGPGEGGRYTAVFFNLFLVASKARKATLVESANDRDFYLRFVKWIEEVDKAFTKEIGAIEIKSAAPQYLVFNTTLFKSTAEVLKMTKTQEGMGNLLGFKCPGELNGRYTLIFKVDGIEFYTERCDERPDKKFIDETLSRFERAVKEGDLKGGGREYKVTYEVETEILPEEWLEIISSSSRLSSVSDFYNQRFDLSNLFENIGMKITAEKIDDLEDEEAFVNFVLKYRQFLIFSLCYYLNDPLEMFYPLTAKQEKESEQKFKDIETLFFFKSV